MTLSEFLDQHPDTHYYHDGNEWGAQRRETGADWAQWVRENPAENSAMCDPCGGSKPPIGACFVWPTRTSLNQWRPGICRYDGHGSILLLIETD